MRDGWMHWMKARVKRNAHTHAAIRTCMLYLKLVRVWQFFFLSLLVFVLFFSFPHLHSFFLVFPVFRFSFFPLLLLLFCWFTFKHMVCNKAMLLLSLIDFFPFFLLIFTNMKVWSKHKTHSLWLKVKMGNEKTKRKADAMCTGGGGGEEAKVWGNQVRVLGLTNTKMRAYARMTWWKRFEFQNKRRKKHIRKKASNWEITHSCIEREGESGSKNKNVERKKFCRENLYYIYICI